MGSAYSNTYFSNGFLVSEIDAAISEALKICKEKQISGKSVTPFLLQHVNNITKGKSLQSSKYKSYFK